MRYLIHLEIYGVLTQDLKIIQLQDKQIGQMSIEVRKRIAKLKRPDQHISQIYNVYILSQRILEMQQDLLKKGTSISAICDLDLINPDLQGYQRIIISVKTLFPKPYDPQDISNIWQEDLSEYEQFFIT